MQGGKNLGGIASSADSMDLLLVHLDGEIAPLNRTALDREGQDEWSEDKLSRSDAKDMVT